MPHWFHQDRYDVPAPMTHLAVSLLVAAAASRDDVFIDCVDQIEPSMSGAWGGTGAEERCGIGVARSVAKAAGTPAEVPIRDVLRQAGVSDWGEFVAEHVVAFGGPYVAEMATFHERDAYRWIRVPALPAPHNPHRLPPELRTSWDRCQRATRYPRPFRRSPQQARDRWIAKHRRTFGPGLAGSWPLTHTDWGHVMSEVRSFLDDSTVGWSRSAVYEWSGGLPDGVGTGFRASLLDPIVCGLDLQALGNGQHRALVMLGQGVEWALVCRY